VWVLPWQGDIMDPQNLVAGILERVGHQQPLVGTTGFGDVQLSLYALRDAPSVVVRDLDAMAPLVQVAPDGPALLGGEAITPSPIPQGGLVEVHTWWLRGTRLIADLRMSVRLYDAGGTFHTQIDQPPAGWTFGQDLWETGVPVLGRTLLWVPTTMPRGRAYVRIVIYDMAGEITPNTVDVAEVTVVADRR
jgi:hypothetical protein